MRLDLNLRNLIIVFVSAAGLSLAACSTSSQGGTTTGNPLVADTSSSGAVAGAVGGSLSGSSSGGVVAQSDSRNSALRYEKVTAQSTTCPTFASTNSDCNTSGSSMWLNYSSCKFPNSSMTWNGTQLLSMSTSTTAACGTFPAPGAGGTLYRQYVTTASSTTPSALLLHDSAGVLATVDDHTTNLSNYDNASISTLLNGGYGFSAHFASANVRDTITFAHRIVTVGVFDQTVVGNLNISETGGSSSRTVSGSVTVYHNGLHIIGNSTFTGLVHNDMCCLPVSGTITTTFQQGTSSPTQIGSLYVGKTETLTITGCGTGTLQNYDGSVQSVSLNRCF